jgi:hypothetical protein
MYFRVPDHVSYRAVHGEVMILDARTDRCFGLNSTGAIIWEVLVAGGTISDAVRAINGSFPSSSPTALDEVTALVDDLVQYNLIESIRP